MLKRTVRTVLPEIGDQVHLKGGLSGTEMLVTEVKHETGKPYFVTCIWFGPDQSIRSHEFDARLLDIDATGEPGQNSEVVETNTGEVEAQRAAA